MARSVKIETGILKPSYGFSLSISLVFAISCSAFFPFPCVLIAERARVYDHLITRTCRRDGVDPADPIGPMRLRVDAVEGRRLPAPACRRYELWNAGIVA